MLYDNKIERTDLENLIKHLA